MFSITRDAAPSPSSWSPCHWRWISLAGRRRAPRPRPPASGRPGPGGVPRPAGGPPAGQARTPTGLAPLDTLLDGGFPQGSSRSWSARGPPGGRGCFSARSRAPRRAAAGRRSSMGRMAWIRRRPRWSACRSAGSSGFAAAAGSHGVARRGHPRPGGRVRAGRDRSGGSIAVDARPHPIRGVRAPPAGGRARGDRAPHRRTPARGRKPRRDRGGARSAGRSLGARRAGVARGARDRGAADPVADPHARRRRPAGVDRARCGGPARPRAARTWARDPRRAVMTAPS